MAKDFDAARAKRPGRSIEERRFTIGGETFVLRETVRPDPIMQAGSTEGKEPSQLLADIDAAILASVEAGDPVANPYRGTNEEEEAKPKEKREPEMIGSSHLAYRRLRERDEDPLTLQNLLDLIQWIVETQTGRPTQQPSDSSNGRGATETTSTAVSSLQASLEE